MGGPSSARCLREPSRFGCPLARSPLDAGDRRECRRCVSAERTAVWLCRRRPAATGAGGQGLGLWSVGKQRLDRGVHVQTRPRRLGI